MKVPMNNSTAVIAALAVVAGAALYHAWTLKNQIANLSDNYDNLLIAAGDRGVGFRR
jgi:hypothetical protein